MAFELAGIPYYFEPAYGGSISAITYPHASDHSLQPFMCGEQILHTLRGKPFWHNGSIFKYKWRSPKDWVFPTHWISGSHQGVWVKAFDVYCYTGMPLSDLNDMRSDGLAELYQSMVSTALRSDAVVLKALSVE